MLQARVGKDGIARQEVIHDLPIEAAARFWQLRRIKHVRSASGAFTKSAPFHEFLKSVHSVPLNVGAARQLKHSLDFFVRQIVDGGSGAPAAPLVGDVIIDPEMEDEVVVRAKELVLVVSGGKATVELFPQWYDMVSLSDGLKLAANKAGLATPRFEGHSGSSNPRAFPIGVLDQIGGPKAMGHGSDAAGRAARSFSAIGSTSSRQ
ncbi:MULTISPECIES: hypothetical protein [unclassified Bradyrhizobium]|uniref:hypothetical protein n=1 Tax=unclassified Bradyrhizobium TaxID=2631580 RepID=UPI001FF88377|nr:MULTISPECIES: hypothetical protein [unclassified Bradyrhizobium]MCK1424576.1 hypothetical protein [Bradyrhizobium sp. CW12]MCK1646439.1 hypothetical protein [Bradyrhizobium sp. 154]MCK1758735.1 hypothetical protein [Bradyrhizobium sp. 137]